MIIFLQSLFKMDSVSLENFSVYLENLSPYYITCVLLSFVAVLLTWWYLEHDTTDTTTNDTFETENVDEDCTVAESTSFLTEMKVARQKAIDKEFSAGMSDEQLQQEKEYVQKRSSLLQFLIFYESRKTNFKSIPWKMCRAK